MIDLPTPSLLHAGQLLTHHAVCDTLLDLTHNTLTVCVGSWLNTLDEGAPLRATELLLHYDLWEPEHFEHLAASVASHPLWCGTGSLPPTPAHGWNPLALRWDAPPPLPLPDLKAAKWAEIKAARNTAELGPFTYNAQVFDGDLNAQRRLAAYISVSKSALAAGQAFAAEFTLANNTLVTLSAQDFVGIELAKVQAVATAFARATALRGQIEAAETSEQVALIGW